MDKNVENLEFLEVDKLPKTQDNNDLFFVSSQEKGRDSKVVTFPAALLAQKDYVDIELNKRAKTSDMVSAQKEIKNISESKADRLELIPIKNNLDIAKSDIRSLEKNKLDKVDASIGLLSLPFDVPTTTQLTKPTIKNPDTGETITLKAGHAVRVLNQVDENGNPYYYQYDGTNWNKTKFTALPSDVATSEDITAVTAKVDNVITNPYSRYDITADPNGWVLSYETALDFSVIDKSKANLESNIIADNKGYVLNGTDWKNRQLSKLVMELNIPNIYTIESDYNGNVISYFKTFKSISPNAPVKLAECITNEFAIIKGNTHYGFPGICSTKRGILYAFFRQGGHHASDDGTILYSISRDYGNNWSTPITLLQGGTVINGDYKRDYRDCKVIRMSNDKILFSTFMMPAKIIAGIPPNNVDYDAANRKSYVYIIDVLPNDMLDIDNMQEIELPAITQPNHALSAGGLVEHNKTIYHTLYGDTPNNCYLIKSEDFGLTWELVSKIQDLHNENSIAFIEETMYCIMRQSAHDGIEDKKLVGQIVKSADFGKTWEVVRDIDTYIHGLYALALGDTIMIAGRAYNERTHIFFMDKMGDFVLNPISIGNSGDSAYAQICTLESYVHIVYYSQLSPTSWGIFTRKIERNKVLGLSY